MIRLSPGFGFGGPVECVIPRAVLESNSVPVHTLLPTLKSCSTQGEIDRYWMAEALKESLTGVGITNPNPAVGCVIVDSFGKELARGATQAYGGLHAERSAFERLKEKGLAVDLLQGATVYVTLEPCSHFGNQPPCADLIASAPIKRVVIARGDPNPLVQGGGVRRLRESGKEVEVGVLQNEATAWNFPFLAQQILGRPMVALKWAQTLDGQLADDQNHSQWITGKPARAYTHWLRQRYDAVLVGIGTFLIDRPKLTVRDCIPPHQRQPLPVVLDLGGQGVSLSGVLQKCVIDQVQSLNRPLVWIAPQESFTRPQSAWLRSIEGVHALGLSTEGHSAQQKLDALLPALQGEVVTRLLGRPLQSVLVEGGAKTLAAFLEAKLGDVLHAWIAPKITGGTENRIYTGASLSGAHSFHLISDLRMGQDLLMEMVSTESLRVFSQDFS